MPHDLGDVIPLSVEVRDATGAPANAGSMKLTITPDAGTATIVDPVTPTTQGVYDNDFATTLAGRHRVQWKATGANSGVWEYAFVVEDPAHIPFINNDEAVNHLRASGVIVSPNDLEQLRWLCMVACDAVERDLGRVIGTRSVTEIYNGGSDVIRLRQSPIVSVTSVTESGTLLTAADYVVNTGHGILYRGSTTTPRSFLWGRQNITVVYVPGYANPPRTARKVALNGVERMWQSSQQTAHPMLDDVSAEAAIFAAAGSLTPLELGAYRALQGLGTA